MKIAYIAAGAGGMYCGSCIHDNTLAAALLRKGHEVALIPTYTPIRTDETNVSIDRVFYGGINIYLQEKLPLFGRMPAVVDGMLSNPRLLQWVSRFSSSTNPEQLGALTVSVLSGEQGHQRHELKKLIDWLKRDYHPEIIHLTNSMFVGMAKEIKKALGVPILCAMQGEDLFLNNLQEPHKREALNVLRIRARDVDGFVATSRYYADFMMNYIGVPRDKIHIVKLGIHLRGHGEKLPRSGDRNPFVIGYLARICPEKGLHLLVKAVGQLAKNHKPHSLKLRVAGYLGARDRQYFEEIKKDVVASGLQDIFEYVGEIDRTQKIEFLNSLDVLSVPTTYQDPKGLFILEALANGVPVIQPRHGAFPEILGATGGGILVDPDSPEALCHGIQSMLTNAPWRREMGEKGKAAVHQLFSDAAMAEATIKVYEKFL